MSDLLQTNFSITSLNRIRHKRQQPYVVWFTGLSGSGKSTLADILEKELFRLGFHTYLLDGDNMRNGINADLTFSSEDRSENIRRVAEISKLFLDAGLIILASFISPFREDREKAKAIIGADKFVEIYVSTSLEVCESRDVKGLYEKARAGKIQNFTGVSSPYESPTYPDIEIDTNQLSTEKAVKKILELLIKRFVKSAIIEQVL